MTIKILLDRRSDVALMQQLCFALGARLSAISTLDVKGLEAARICHQAGAEMLQVIAGALPMPETALARTEAYVTDASANFDAAYDKLLAGGFPVRGDREACRRSFLVLERFTD